MEQENRKYIAIIAFIRKFIKVFFSVFFNIYILKIVNNDFNFIIKYNLFAVFIDFIVCYIILKFINSKNAKIIYKSSFILLIITIALLLLFKERIINYIYILKLLERTATVMYSMPYELAIIGSNNKNTMNNFMANIFILESIATILTPFFSGLLIEKFSYYMLFAILMIQVMIIIVISLKIQDFTVSDKELEIKKFYKNIKDKKNMKDVYKCMFYRRISSRGIIEDLLPIILFLRVRTEINLGAYNSIFATISIVSLQILKVLTKKNIKKNFYTYFAVMIFLSSIVVIYNSSFISLLVYYILVNSLGAIIESESCSAIYQSIRANNLEEYKKEHIFIYNIYMTLGQIISYVLVYVIYNYFYSVNSLSISVAILMFFLIMSSIYLNKTEKYIEKSSIA